MQSASELLERANTARCSGAEDCNAAGKGSEPKHQGRERERDGSSLEDKERGVERGVEGGREGERGMKVRRRGVRNGGDGGMDNRLGGREE